MKRFAAIAFLLLLALSGCGLRESEVSDGGSEEESYETSFPPLPVPAEPRVLIGLPLRIRDDVYAAPDFNTMAGDHEQDAVYVGDTQGDADACREAGVPMVYAAYGFGDVKEPWAVIQSMGELLEEDLWQGQ